MSLDEIKDLIRQAGELGAYNVVFTGGEPTLLGSRLPEVFRYTRDETPIASMRMVSNGKWATTYERAYKKLKAWKEAGLVELNISCGEFHQEFVPIERTINAYTAARDLDYPTVLICGVFLAEGKGERSPDLYRDAIKEATGEAPLSTDIMSPYTSEYHGFTCGSAMNYGRGRQFIRVEDMAMVDEEKIPSLCSDVLGAFTVHPNGNMTACCGIMVRKESLLNIGNWREERLRPMIEKAHRDTVLNWIKYLGLKDMKRWLQEKDPTLEFRSEYVSICDLCAEIVYNPRCQELLNMYSRERNDDILLNKIAHDATTYSTSFVYTSAETAGARK